MVAPKLLTLVIVQRPTMVLLGRKKRGFGEGYYNGFGGKVEAGETVPEAAIREVYASANKSLQEESGVLAKDLHHRGVLTFNFDDNPQPWEVHVFQVTEWEGEPHETEEMAPQWFNNEDIPYENMWADDPYWYRYRHSSNQCNTFLMYPLFLQGSCFQGSFDFKDTHTLLKQELKEVTAAELSAATQG